MALSSTQSTVADYFFVTGLRDNDLLSTYNLVKSGQAIQNDATYYNNQATCAAGTSSEKRVKTPPPTATTTMIQDEVAESFSAATNVGRKRGQSLPVLPSSAQTQKEQEQHETLSDSLTDVMDHVQAVIDHFDWERDYARDSVIAIPTPPSPSSSGITSNTLASWDKSRRASMNAGHTPLSKRSSVHGTSWQRTVDSLSSTVKRTHTKRRQRQYSMSHPSPPTEVTKQPPLLASTDENEESTQPHLLDVRYPPTVLTRYPTRDGALPFPSYLSMFSFPHDISLHYGDDPPPERIHSFTLTDDTGSTRYGTCCVFYEPVPTDLVDQVDEALQSWVDNCMTTSTVEYGRHLQEKILFERNQVQTYTYELASYTTKSTTVENIERCYELEEQLRMSRESLTLYSELLEPVKLSVCTSKQIWIPKSIGVLGRLPWLDFYGDWIKILLDSVVGVCGKKNKDLSIDVGSAVINLIHQVPIPPPGRFEIGLSINDRSLFISRPAMNEVPLLKNFSLYPVFRALSPHLILAILETLLAEGKVLFLSQYCGMLSLACESFRYLLFPFHWQFVFIPLLPERLLNCLQAPIPYMIGFQGDMNDIDEFVPEDACIVNLDSNTIHQSTRVPMLPERQRKKLQASIELHCPLHTRCRVPYGVPLSVQVAFPNGRLLLSCNRSKLQDVFETPASRNRTSESSDSSSIWSTSKVGWQLPRSSGLRNSSNGTGKRDSIDSFQSSVMNATDLSQQPMPQLPSFAKLVINPQTSVSPSSSSVHSNSSSTPPISPATQASKLNGRPQQRSSMPATPKLSQSHSVGADKEHGGSSLYKMQNRMSDPPPLRKSTPAEKGILLTEGIQKNSLPSTMSKPRAAFQHSSEPSHISSTTMTATANAAINYGASMKYNQHYQHGTPREISRHVKHIEGHIMMTLLPQELSSFQGFRCLCGKHVDQEVPIQNLYRICQECHLVTHDSCTDHILHPCLPACFDETKIQDSLLRMFASLLYGYRSGFMDPVEHPISSESSVFLNSNATGHHIRKSIYFSKEAFLKHSDKDTRAYLSSLAGSQMFTQFITDRLSKPKNDPEILMFDEFIKLKLNRSKLKFVKEDTPFLNDDSYRVSQVIWTAPPKDENGRIYDRFPTDLSISE